MDVVLGVNLGMNTVHIFEHCENVARLGESESCASIPTNSRRASNSDQVSQPPPKLPYPTEDSFMPRSLHCCRHSVFSLIPPVVSKLCAAGL